MRNDRTIKKGSVMLMVIFAIALLSMIVIALCQINTEEIQLMQNHEGGVRAIICAEAGINDAMARIREDSSCLLTDFPISESFDGGSYTVSVEGAIPDPNLVATAISSDGYTARVRAELTVGNESPHQIRIDQIRINE